MYVRESQIEDILATYPQITQKVLGIDKELSLLARQKTLNSGRLDLLFASEDKLLLLELKVENFKREFVDQVEAYRSDLLSLQSEGLLLNGCIEALLVCPVFTTSGLDLCKSHDIIPVEYSPMEVLQEFFTRLKMHSPFVALRPVDSGLWNIYLINRVLYALAETNNLEEIRAKAGLSTRTIGT